MLRHGGTSLSPGLYRVLLSSCSSAAFVVSREPASMLPIAGQTLLYSRGEEFGLNGVTAGGVDPQTGAGFGSLLL